MEKKEYLAPRMGIMEMESETLMLGLSGAQGGLDGTTTGGQVSGGDADANGRRGSWGDLWGSEE